MVVHSSELKLFLEISKSLKFIAAQPSLSCGMCKESNFEYQSLVFCHFLGSSKAVIDFSKSPSSTKDFLLVHASATVPPQLEWIIPIGTFNSLCNRLAKKYAVALKSPTVLGEQLSHSPLTESITFVE